MNRPFDGRSNARYYADQLGQAPSVDMTHWFIPIGAISFQNINCSGIEAAVAEAKSEDTACNVRAAGTKSEASIVAEPLVAGSGRLPALDRIHVAGDVIEEGCSVLSFAIAPE